MEFYLKNYLRAMKINSDSCLLRAKAGEFFIVAYIYIDHLSALF